MRTTATFDQMTTNEDWLGFGYLGERDRQGADRPERVAEADAFILARTADWTDEELFDWANSKLGRWVGDIFFGTTFPVSDRDQRRAADYIRK